MPQPMTPTVMRSEGAARPARPRALAGMRVGASTAAPAAVVVAERKRRRESPWEAGDVFIGGEISGLHGGAGAEKLGGGTPRAFFSLAAPFLRALPRSVIKKTNTPPPPRQTPHAPPP